MPPFEGIPYNLGTLRALVEATNSCYPQSVHLGHDLISIAEWRGHRGDQSENLHNLLASFFCFGNGGSIAVDLLLEGGPWQMFKHNSVAKYWLLSFLAVYKTPGDIIYKMLMTPRHPIRLVAHSLDAIDSVTSVCGIMEKGAQLFPGNPLAPFMAGIVMQRGGAMFRYIEERGRGLEPKYPFASIDYSMKRAIFYVMAYWSLTRRAGVSKNVARWWMTLFGIGSAMAQELHGQDSLSWLKPIEFGE